VKFGYFLFMLWAFYLIFVGPFLLSSASWLGVGLGLGLLVILIALSVSLLKRKVNSIGG
jgi:hypothetical protein